jgi:hypothetical protein
LPWRCCEARAGIRLPPLRTGRPLTREALVLWPHLAQRWCRAKGETRVPRGRKGPFVTFVRDVHAAIDLPPPDEDVLHRAVPGINAALPFRLQVARDLAKLARRYES